MLVEAFCPDKEEFEKAAQRSEYKVIEVNMDNQGVVHIDDYTDPKPYDRSKTKVYIRLNYNKSEVDIYKDNLHGNKVDPSLQQLIAALLKKGVIDSSWKVSFSDDAGYYMGGEYATRKGEFEGLPPNFWKRNSRIGIGTNLVLYHGTDTLALPTIKKYGLRPLGMEHTSPGYESRLRIEENKNFLYLTGTFESAFGYARTRARSDMRSTNKEDYEYVEHWEWERWFIKPVVLLVTLPDFTKLRSDDDRVIGIIKDKGYKIWDVMPSEQKEEEKKKTIEWFRQRGINYTPHEIEGFQWVRSDNGFEVTIKHIDKSEWNNWKASLKSNNQVAYAGVIPPQYLKVLDLTKVFRKPRDLRPHQQKSTDT